MKAWRMYGINDMRLDDIPVPEVKAGWVLIKVRTLQPSITEVQQLTGSLDSDVMGVTNLEKLLEEKGPLQKFGHEFCGEVVEVGEGASNLKIGDRVFFWRRVPCGNCALCLAGYEELCFHGPVAGSNIPGCLAEYVLLPAGSIASIPDSINDSEATAMQPLMVATGAVHATGIEMGDTVVVLGQGSMGLNVMQLSRVCNAGKAIAVDVRDDVLAFSSQFGADITINAHKTDLEEAVLEATGGVGADIVFECAGGSPERGLAGTKTLSQAIRVVRNQGKITQVALLAPNAAVEVSPLISKGIQYRGPGAESQKLLRYTIELVSSKRVQLAPLVNYVLEGLERVPEAFEITGNKAKYGAINPAQVIVTR